MSKRSERTRFIHPVETHNNRNVSGDFLHELDSIRLQYQYVLNKIMYRSERPLFSSFRKISNFFFSLSISFLAVFGMCPIFVTVYFYRSQHSWIVWYYGNRCFELYFLCIAIAAIEHTPVAMFRTGGTIETIVSPSLFVFLLTKQTFTNNYLKILFFYLHYS